MSKQQEYKIGDKVRIISLDDPGYFQSADQGLVVGNTGTITDAWEREDGFGYSVRTDNAKEPVPFFFEGDGWGFPGSSLELAEG